MKKVLVIRDELLPLSETFIRAQAITLTRWTPVLVGKSFVANGVSVSDLKCLLVLSGCGRLLQKILFNLLWFFPFLAWPSIQKIKRENANLVHAHFGTELVAWWPILRQLGLPVIATLHGSDINIYRHVWEEKRNLFAKLYPRRLLKIARDANVRFIAVSQAIKNRAIAYGIPAEKITVKYIGVDTQTFVPDTANPIALRKKRILYTGRMTEKKGALYLIEAFGIVRHHIPDAELVMIGAGTLLPAAKQKAAELNLDVQFLGGLSSQQVLAELNQSRVFCLPSITAENGDAEGFSIVVLEAQSCGVPVATSARGSTTEGIIHGETGFAFDEKDVPALASYLVRMLSNDTLIEHMSTAARKLMTDKFDILDCTRLLEDYYDEDYYHTAAH